VQLPGTAAWLSASQFHAAANQRQVVRDLIVRDNDVLLAQVQQSVACNALHTLEARLGRWLLQAHDCIAGHAIPLTQEFLAQMLGVRRTTVTLAARLLQSAGVIRYRRGLVQIVDRPALENSPVNAMPLYGVTRTGFFRSQMALEGNHQLNAEIVIYRQRSPWRRWQRETSAPASTMERCHAPILFPY
jgi:hypothetical protein